MQRQTQRYSMTLLKCVIKRAAPIFLLAGLIPSAQVYAQTCPYSAMGSTKRQALYLFFPTTTTNVTVGGTSYSVAAFNVADLDNTIGTTADLRNRIFEIVRGSYCELSVEVKQTTTVPAPTESRYEIVGIGTDTDSLEIFGNAYEIDTGDAHGQDYSRVFAKQFLASYGGTGGALTGTNSTLERWATAIGGTAAHEPGHDYGLVHSNAQPRTGSSEDATLNHVMATAGDFGSTTFERGDNRARRIRHFSDTSFEILGHNIGLNYATLSNWDFVNPNSENATSLRIRLLSSAASLTLGGVYSGSPWTNPTLQKQAGTQTLQGTAYNIYDLTFSTAQAWSGGAAGTVAPGTKFHVGAAVSDAIIVYEVVLSGASGELPLRPRMFGYDAGTTTADGDFDIRFFNARPGDGDLILRNIEVLFLPRPVSLENMIVGGKPVAWDGLTVTPFRRQPASTEQTTASAQTHAQAAAEFPTANTALTVGRNPVALRIARLSDKRHVDLFYRKDGCVPGVRKPSGFTPFDIDMTEVVYCPEGPALSLFPATYTYVIATVVDPNAKHWDAAQGRIVTGPVESRLFYQVQGIVPDLNHNGIDDLLDIREHRSQDVNANGVPDEVEPARPHSRRPIAISARVGGAIPHTSGLDLGPSFNIGIEYYLKPRWTLEGTGGVHWFSMSGLSRRAHVTQFSANTRYYAVTQGPFSLFVNGGAGAYRFDPGGQTKFGGNAGLGIDLRLKPKLELEGAYNYHRVHTGGSGFGFSTVQAGFRFRF